MSLTRAQRGPLSDLFPLVTSEGGGALATPSDLTCDHAVLASDTAEHLCYWPVASKSRQLQSERRVLLSSRRMVASPWDVKAVDHRATRGGGTGPSCGRVRVLRSDRSRSPEPMPVGQTAVNLGRERAVSRVDSRLPGRVVPLTGAGPRMGVVGAVPLRRDEARTYINPSARASFRFWRRW